MPFYPGDRIPAVAARILTAQPDPPRSVSWRDIWAINWPLLVFISAIALVPAVWLAMLRTSYLVVLLFPFSAIVVLAAWFSAQVVPYVAALRGGVPDIGTVVELTRIPRGGYRGRMRLDRGASTDPVDFLYESTRPIKPGDRLDVLVSPSKGKVMLTLGLNRNG